VLIRSHWVGVWRMSEFGRGIVRSACLLQISRNWAGDLASLSTKWSTSGNCSCDAGEQRARRDDS